MPKEFGLGMFQWVSGVGFNLRHDDDSIWWNFKDLRCLNLNWIKKSFLVIVGLVLELFRTVNIKPDSSRQCSLVVSNCSTFFSNLHLLSFPYRPPYEVFACLICFKTKTFRAASTVVINDKVLRATKGDTRVDSLSYRHIPRLIKVRY